MQYLVVFCTCPDEETALSLAKKLVETKLAACVNLMPSLQSVYQWKNQIETAKEVLMILKTNAQAYKKLETFLQKAHPYECPEIIAVPITQGLPGYLKWIDESLLNTH